MRDAQVGNPWFLRAAKLTGRMEEVVSGVFSGKSTGSLARDLGVSESYIRATKRAAMNRMRSFAEMHPHWFPWLYEYKRGMNERTRRRVSNG